MQSFGHCHIVCSKHMSNVVPLTLDASNYRPRRKRSIMQQTMALCSHQQTTVTEQIVYASMKR